MTNFVYGFSPSVENAALMDIDQVDAGTGKNTGNLAFCYAIWRQLEGLPTVGWSVKNSPLFSSQSIGVLALANQLGPHANMGYFADILRDHESRLVGIGLGAQGVFGKEFSMPQGSHDWVRLIQERSPSDGPNISVRGEYTFSILKQYGLSEKAVVLGCPTLFISPELHLGKKIESNWRRSPRRIAVAAGHPGWSGLWKLETSLGEMLTSAQDYIVQSPTSMIAFGRGLDHKLTAEDFEKIRRYVRPKSNFDDFEDWRLTHAVSFFSASAWMEHLRRFDFVVGLRIHGVMLALQMGIPGVCIVHDSRTKELCETMKVPHIDVEVIKNGVTKEQLVETFDSNFDAVDFDDNRYFLGRKYFNFLRSNKLNVAAYMNSFV